MKGIGNPFIKKRINVVTVLFGIFFLFLIVHRFFIEMGVPSATKYLLDVFNIIFFMYALLKTRKISNYDKYYVLCYVGIIFLGTVSFIMNITYTDSDVAFDIFDIRNLLRFVMFFFSCKVLINKNNILNIYKNILGIHIINSLLVIYQFFTLEVDIYWMRGDNLNGFFGVKTGGNIYLNALLIATTIIALELWKNWGKSYKIAVFFILLNLMIATLVELKGFYIEILIIFIIYFGDYIKKVTPKKLCVIVFALVIGGVGLILLVQLLYKLYPWMDGTMSSLMGMIKATKSTADSGTISRISFISDVYYKIFNKDILNMLFGYGIGSANINGNMTGLARMYYSTQYSWLSSAYMFVELGLCGLILYFVSFIILLIEIVKKGILKKCGISAVVCSIFCIIYNETFKTDAGYFLFFLIAIASAPKLKNES